MGYLTYWPHHIKKGNNMTIDWSDEALKREREREEKDKNKKPSDYQGSGNMAYKRNSDIIPKHEYEKTRGV